MFLLGFRRKLTALALCKSIESAIQWFQIHHRITFATMQNPAVYLLGARVSIFSTLVPRLLRNEMVDKQAKTSLSLEPSFFKIPFSNFKPSINKYVLQQWQTLCKPNIYVFDPHLN